MKTTPVQIELQILREEILANEYFHRQCPISRALARAGYPDLQDTGLHIVDMSGLPVCDINGDKNYSQLVRTVCGMYICIKPEKYEATPKDIPFIQAPRDFTATITLNLPTCAN